MGGERLAIATEAVGLAEQIGDRAMALRGRGLRRIDLLELADLAGYDADLAAAERTAEELRQLRYRWQLPLAHATRALLAGRFAQAEELIEQGLAAGRRAGDQAVGHYYTGVVATLRLMQGRFADLIELLRDGAARFPAMAVFRAGLAAALAEAGRADQARAEVERLAAGDLAAVPRDPAWSYSLANLALACYHLGDVRHRPSSCIRCWNRTPTATSSPAASAPSAWGRRPTSWGCLTSPAASPTRHCAALRRQSRWPAACRPARWWR